MMKQHMRNLTGQVQDTLLALPDAMLTETLTHWLDCADETLEHAGWSSRYCSVLGYRVRSEKTSTIYPSGEALDQAKPGESYGSRMAPSVQAMPRVLMKLPPEDFYHTILPLAKHASGWQTPREGRGLPLPGQTLMRPLAARLRSQGPVYGRVALWRPTVRKRRPLHRSSSDPAYWRLRSAHPVAHSPVLRCRSNHYGGSGSDPSYKPKKRRACARKDRYETTEQSADTTAEHKATTSG
jgi:hypothetical protein